MPVVSEVVPASHGFL
ncbi:hypothetical protein MTR67_007376 [Solanum verrucosum]|uniref:Uncharacterized protein n=1 Tax=Solanum verrucosum TaxID=315347 RepID=A0AAF0Q517_SOLVR|nr:hypothetical protein MTR67_007376 [Solanum verrucosum]